MKEEKLRQIIREELGAMMSVASGDERLLEDKEVASILGIKVRTLQNWRVKGKGPDHVQISGKSPRYTRAAVAKFLAERTVRGR